MKVFFFSVFLIVSFFFTRVEAWVVFMHIIGFVKSLSVNDTNIYNLVNLCMRVVVYRYSN